MQSPKFFGISFPPQKSSSSREQRESESESDLESCLETRAEKDYERGREQLHFIIIWMGVNLAWVGGVNGCAVYPSSTKALNRNRREEGE
jgi:hypothetical protein